MKNTRPVPSDRSASKTRNSRLAESGVYPIFVLLYPVSSNARVSIDAGLYRHNTVSRFEGVDKKRRVKK